MLFKRLSYRVDISFWRKGRVAEKPDGFKRFGFFVFSLFSMQTAYAYHSENCIFKGENMEEHNEAEDY
jgi:hypothetical protein